MMIGWSGQQFRRFSMRSRHMKLMITAMSAFIIIRHCEAAMNEYAVKFVDQIPRERKNEAEEAVYETVQRFGMAGGLNPLIRKQWTPEQRRMREELPTELITQEIGRKLLSMRICARFEVKAVVPTAYMLLATKLYLERYLQGKPELEDIAIRSMSSSISKEEKEESNRVTYLKYGLENPTDRRLTLEERDLSQEGAISAEDVYRACEGKWRSKPARMEWWAVNNSVVSWMQENGNTDKLVEQTISWITEMGPKISNTLSSKPGVWQAPLSAPVAQNDDELITIVQYLKERIRLEIEAAQQYATRGAVMIIRGTAFPGEEEQVGQGTYPYSYSFATPMAGILHDAKSGSALGAIMKRKNSIEGWLLEARAHEIVYIPPQPLLMALHGYGEIHHPRLRLAPDARESFPTRISESPLWISRQSDCETMPDVQTRENPQRFAFIVRQEMAPYRIQMVVEAVKGIKPGMAVYQADGLKSFEAWRQSCVRVLQQTTPEERQNARKDARQRILERIEIYREASLSIDLKRDLETNQQIVNRYESAAELAISPNGELRFRRVDGAWVKDIEELTTQVAASPIDDPVAMENSDEEQ
jgi:hypothetical protein